jgi:hypothetical protein
MPGRRLLERATGGVVFDKFILRSNAVWLGDVEAASEAEAIAKWAEEFKQPKERLMAVRR